MESRLYRAALRERDTPKILDKVSLSIRPSRQAYNTTSGFNFEQRNFHVASNLSKKKKCFLSHECVLVTVVFLCRFFVLYDVILCTITRNYIILPILLTVSKLYQYLLHLLSVCDENSWITFCIMYFMYISFCVCF